MKNQLDLQESEWESYEETFNAIVEKLEGVEDELAAMTNERDILLEEKKKWEWLSADHETLSATLAEVRAVSLCVLCLEKDDHINIICDCFGDMLTNNSLGVTVSVPPAMR